jgi:hypothetical protein
VTEAAVLLFRLSSPALVAGLRRPVGRPVASGHHHGLKESSGVLQGALLGFMGLILAFGLSLALGRYQDRRAAVVDDANTIGTACLGAQTPVEHALMPLTGPHCRPAA